MVYKQGLHILAEIESSETVLLSRCSDFKLLADALILEKHLQKVGEVYHSFDNAGYTAIVCLTESHISIHTWPEFGLATFDVFLSNFMKNNDEAGRYILQQTVAFFKSEKYTSKEIRR